jgi:hypothetical protein
MLICHRSARNYLSLLLDVHREELFRAAGGGGGGVGGGSSDGQALLVQYENGIHIRDDNDPSCCYYTSKQGNVMRQSK